MESPATNNLFPSTSGGSEFDANSDIKKHDTHTKKARLFAVMEAADALASLSEGSGSESSSLLSGGENSLANPIKPPNSKQNGTRGDGKKENKLLTSSSIGSALSLSSFAPLSSTSASTAVARGLAPKLSLPMPKQRHLPRHKKPNAALTFPEKLMFLMTYADEIGRNDPSFSVAWLPAGDAFAVRSPSDFVRDIVPLFFKQTKFASFTRKLYRWGFRQMNRGAGPGEPAIFGNRYFRRDDHSLMIKMRSVTTTTATGSGSTSSAEGGSAALWMIARNQQYHQPSCAGWPHPYSGSYLPLGGGPEAQASPASPLVVGAAVSRTNMGASAAPAAPIPSWGGEGVFKTAPSSYPQLAEMKSVQQVSSATFEPMALPAPPAHLLPHQEHKTTINAAHPTHVLHQSVIVHVHHHHNRSSGTSNENTNNNDATSQSIGIGPPHHPSGSNSPIMMSSFPPPMTTHASSASANIPVIQPHQHPVVVATGLTPSAASSCELSPPVGLSASQLLQPVSLNVLRQQQQEQWSQQHGQVYAG